MRATTTASMDTPGPYETHATEAYFNVTLPDAKMTPAEVDGYMHGFNIGTVVSTAVHEAFPGHYIQFLWLRRLQARCANCWAPIPMSKAGRTIANR